MPLGVGSVNILPQYGIECTLSNSNQYHVWEGGRREGGALRYDTIALGLLKKEEEDRRRRLPDLLQKWIVY